MVSWKVRSADRVACGIRDVKRGGLHQSITSIISSVLKLFIPHIDGLQAYNTYVCVAGGVEREATLNSI